jgi:pyruvate dehydrogenase E1 component alpha subunit
MEKSKLLDLYRTMQKIRKFELRAAKGFAEGTIRGDVHLYVGEEAIATGVCANLNHDDYITSTHRGHGHLIAKGADLKLMLAELYGRETGYCKGKGGSMHIATDSLGILGSNGIVGGGYNLACGAAFSAKALKTKRVCVCFFGDGSMAEGSSHEAMNIASLWKLPVIFVNENNFYAISCGVSSSVPTKDTATRALAYDMPAVTIDGNDVLTVYAEAKKAIERARNGEGPSFIECKTYRWRGHYEGDMDVYRTKEELKSWKAKEKEPIARFEKYLTENCAVTEDEFKQIKDSIDEEIAKANEFALNSPYPDKSIACTDVYTDIVEEGRA